MDSIDIIHDIKPINRMLQTIKESKIMIDKATMYFGKKQSQFMDNMLTLSHPTQYRNLRQILSEIERSQQALDEAYIKHRKNKIQLEYLKNKDINIYGLERAQVDIEMDEIKLGMKSSEKYICGAIRKIKNYIDQYNKIIENIKRERNVTELTEKDFEEEEEKYHIKTAYAQALTAARSRQGLIDEGNHIYFYQIGINGATAQKNIGIHMRMEGELIKQNQEPSHDMILKFLEEMYQKHKGCSKTYAEYKGIEIYNNDAILMGDVCKS
jgi:hypothetical protein